MLRAMPSCFPNRISECSANLEYSCGKKRKEKENSCEDHGKNAARTFNDIPKELPHFWQETAFPFKTQSEQSLPTPYVEPRRAK